MTRQAKFRKDGELDGRGHAEGSRSTRFTVDDGRERPGRPKGAKSLKTILQAMAGMSITVVDPDGRKRQITTIEGVVLKIRDKALKGEMRAIEYLVDRVSEYEPAEAERDQTAALLNEDLAILASAKDRGVLGSASGFNT